MNETRRCPECDAEIPVDSPAGQCPKCMMKAGFASEDLSQPPLDETAPRPGSAGFQAPPVEEIAQRFPQLEVLELLGHGGMGAVYKARQPGLNRLVAVKILPPEVGRDPAFTERFTREARAMARLSHPNIVAIHDFGQTDGLFYFVMEFIDGANLRQTMQAGGLKPEEALAVVPQICDALQFAHDEGIVHRDIKPENILIDKRGRVKIADFGLAKLVHADSAGAAPLPEISLTGTEQVMGTLRYMAPEQMLGTKSVDHRADIYSLGVVFYELLTGNVPMGRFVPPSKKVQIDIRLDEVVLRTLEEEPEKRYQHASEVKTDVEAVRNSSHRAHAKPGTAAKDRTSAAAEHPLLAGLRFWMTPQRPNYVRWVALPLLILTAVCMVIGITVAFAVPAEIEWAHMLSVVGNGGVLLGTAFVLHLWWAVKGQHLQPRASTAAAGHATAGHAADAEPVRVLPCHPLDLRWRATPATLRLLVHLALGAAYLFCLLLVFSFQASRAGDNSIFRLGQPSPWFEITRNELSWSWSFHIFSWPVLAALVACGAVALTRRLEQAEKGNAHPMWLHYGVWTLMIAAAIGVGAINTGRIIPVGNPVSHAGDVAYLDGHTSIVRGVAVSPDGRTLVSSGTDGRVIVRELPSGKLRHIARTNDSDPSKPAPALFGVAISPHNMYALAGGNADTGVLRVRLDKNQADTLRVPSNGAIKVVASYDGGHRLAFVRGDSEMVFLTFADMKEVVAPIHPGKFFGNVRTSAADPDGRFVAVTSSDMVQGKDGGWTSAKPCQLTVFDTLAGKEALTWRFQDYADFSFAQVVFPDQRSMMVCLPSGQLRRWTLDANDQWTENPQPVRISPGQYTAAAASRDGKVIWLAQERQVVGVSEATGKAVAFADLDIGARRDSYSAFPIESLAATAEPNTVAAALWDGRVALARCQSLDADGPALAEKAKETIALEGEEHLPFPTLFFKVGETVKPTERVIYYKTPFASPPYLTYDLKVPFAKEWETGYQVVNEKADSFTLRRMTPSRHQIRVEANGEIMPDSGPAHEPVEALKFKWKAEGRPAPADMPIPTESSGPTDVGSVTIGTKPIWPLSDVQLLPVESCFHEFLGHVIKERFGDAVKLATKRFQDELAKQTDEPDAADAAELGLRRRIHGPADATQSVTWSHYEGTISSVTTDAVRYRGQLSIVRKITVLLLVWQHSSIVIGVYRTQFGVLPSFPRWLCVGCRNNAE